MGSTMDIAKDPLLCSVLYVCYQVTQGQMVMDCCLEVNKKEIPPRIVTGYQPQVRGQGCSIDAMVFLTKKGRKLCAATGPAWVTNLMKHMDKLIKMCHNTNFKGKHCKKMKPKHS
ncbi:C-C motif chemokine 20-like [Salvelinus sp. IW2-2015]|uniref:C-C motif chemokine 20-like n=1 Tax=Salvelinus sp. IW2-2015 TaxID=2691554 RepID=UPI000CEACEB6|nr:C-C motif chemokine 19-like [Salvelinus alpinus]